MNADQKSKNADRATAGDFLFISARIRVNPRQSFVVIVFVGYGDRQECLFYSNFTETNFETPTSSIVTPYRALAISIVRLL